MTRPEAPFAAAHRGLSAEVVENTIAAFQAAADAGFRAFETDLRMTQDGEVVLLHDAGLERTTGVPGRVGDMAYDEVRAHRTEAGPVPRLDDALGRFPDIHWILECKVVAAVRPTLELVRHHGIDATVSAVDPRALRTAREAARDVPRALIVMGGVDEMDLAEAEHLQCTWVHADARTLDARRAGLVQDAGLRLGAWTVNEPVQAEEFVAMGAQCVITDVRDVHDVLC